MDTEPSQRHEEVAMSSLREDLKTERLSLEWVAHWDMDPQPGQTCVGHGWRVISSELFETSEAERWFVVVAGNVGTQHWMV